MSSAPPEPEFTTSSTSIPEVSPMQGSEELQDGGGVTIAVSTVQYTEVRRTRSELEQIPTIFVVNNQYTYEVRTIPYYVVEPDRLVFEIRIVNNLEHVLRLEGMLVRFSVDGQSVTLDDDSGIEEMLAGFLAPREQRVYTIQGPRTFELPASANIALLLYDVVTESDVAGTPTRRANFEWFYQYSVREERRTEQVMIQEMQMTQQEAQALRMSGPAMPATYQSGGGGTQQSSGCTNTCQWAGDGECDDGGPGSLYAVCALGTDCTDCGVR